MKISETNRRAFVLGGLGALAAGVAPRRRAEASAGPWYRDDPVGLAARARNKGLLFGTAIGPAIETDADYRRVVLADCTGVVCEYEMKWEALSRGRATYDFAAADARVDFARAHGLAVRGHALVWYNALPWWVPEALSGPGAEGALFRHIRTVAGRYAGVVRSWDVVNEALDVSSAGRDGFRPSPFLDAFGPGHVDLAFRMAAEAVPETELVYNENGVEYRTAESAAKRRALLGLLEGLRKRGAPIHALGIQCHGATDGPEAFDVPAIAELCREAAGLGLAVYITELDVSDQWAPADVDARDAVVADTYRRLMEATLAVPAVRGVLTWGLSDRYTWLAEERRRPDGLSVRPLLYDGGLVRKRAWAAVAETIDQAVAR